MASSKSRQRKLARAKMERQLVRRAAKARRRRQVQAGTAIGVAVLVLVFGGLWLGGAFSSGKKATPQADCLWTAAAASAVQGIAQPPNFGVAKTGTDTMTINTDQGTVTVNIDLAKTPCTGASLNYLASKGFYNNTKCTKLNTATHQLICGDPTGDGTGGPGYTSVDENVPQPDPSPTASDSASPTASAAPSPSASDATATYTYPRGTVIMVQNGGPDTNGSQFAIIYQDSPLPASYTVVGTVTAGMDVVDKVVAGGVVAGGASTTEGAPNTAVTISTVTVAPYGTTPSASATPSGSADPSQSASSTAAPAASS